MLTLALDTATTLLSVAVGQGGKALGVETSTARRGQSEDLLPLIEKACASAGCKLTDIQRIIAITGPGSFTGLRIGLAAAKGLAFGLNVPLTGVSAFAVARRAVPQANAVVLESWREELFVQIDGGAAEMLTPAEIAARLQPHWVLTGDAAEKVEGATLAPLPPLAVTLLAMADDLADSAEPIAPYYVRPPDISQPKAK